MEERLLFVIGSPRSGSTMLQRMLGSHSMIYTHPEPHLIQPLYYMGFFDRVDAAPYDHINASEAMREYVQALPGGRRDYVDACRAYLDVLYGRMLEPTGRRYFLDKTPANALVAELLAELYPLARYIVLTRHPLAVLSSYAESFFEGDFEAAHAFNPVLERYVPAIARFLRHGKVPFVHLRYEDLVSSPESEMRRVLDFLGLDFEEATIDYGEGRHETKSYGDPKVTEHKRPVTGSVEKWASILMADARGMAVARRAVEPLDEEDLAAWGYPRESLLEPLERAGQPPAESGKWKMSRYRLKRRVLLRLRGEPAAHALARRVRYYADVILRDAL
jgi:hypothetical protein